MAIVDIVARVLPGNLAFPQRWVIWFIPIRGGLAQDSFRSVVMRDEN